MQSQPTTRFAKLRSGDWGVRIRKPKENVRRGDIFHVARKDGGTAMVTIEHVVWGGVDKGGGYVTLAAIRSDGGRRRGGGQPRRRGGWCECGWGEDLLSFGYRPGEIVRCPECGGKAEAC